MSHRPELLHYVYEIYLKIKNIDRDNNECLKYFILHCKQLFYSYNMYIIFLCIIYTYDVSTILALDTAVHKCLCLGI